MTSLWKRDALIGGAIGGFFHLIWHLGVTAHPFSDVLWEWGFNVPRLELIGLHLGVLVAHVAVYTMLGILLTSLIRRWRRIG